MNAKALQIVHLAVYDTLADWEFGHAVAHIRAGDWHREPSRFDVRTVSPDGQPVTTMGGLRITPDMALADLEPGDSAMLILPGAETWDSDPGHMEGVAKKAQEFLDAGVPVAAICGATAGLARAGLLDGRRHTSAVPEYLAATGYGGAENYVDADAVTDGNLITAGPTESVAFAREILGRLDICEPHVLDAWYRLYGHGDPSAYPVLMEAAQQ